MPRFRYDPTIPDAGSIGELIARQGQIAGARARDVGNIQAQAALTRGQAWGNAIGSIGDMMSRGIQGYVQQKQDAPLRALKMETAQTQLAGEKANLANEQAAREERAQLTRQDQAFSTFMDEWDGDLRTLQKAAIKTYGPRRGADTFEKLSKGLQTFSASPKDERDLLMLFRDQAQAILALPDPAHRVTAYMAARARNIERGFMTEQDAPAEYDETIVQRLAAFGPREIEQAFTLSPGQQRFGPDGQPIASVPAAERAEPNPNEYSLALQAAGGDPAKALELVRQQRAAGQQERAGYFTQTPIYDPQGRPIGAMKLNARSGEMEFVSPETMGGLTARPMGDLGRRTVDNEAALDQLGRLKTMFDEGGQEDIGPAEGRARRTLQGLPGGVSVMESFGQDTKRFADFEAATRAFSNAMIKAITGAQMSEPEAKRIMGQIPSVTDHPTVWQAKYTQSVANLKDLENRVRTDRNIAGGDTGGGGGDQTDALLDELIGGGR